MIHPADIARRYGDRLLFLGGERAITYADFARQVLQEPVPDSAGPARVDLDWTPAAFVRLLALCLGGRDIAIGCDARPDALGPFRKFGPLLILPTGGTTGAPRHVVHSQQRLLGAYALQERPPVRLLALYAAGHIAGLDTFFQALHRGSTLVLPAGRSPEAIAAAIEAHRVQVLPATPSFLQFLLLSGALEGRDLTCVETVPHGAEPMPPPLRARLQAAFPHAQLLQRFGLTELGALPVRPDPDDPAALFLEDIPGYAWKIEDGELLVQSPRRMLGTLEEGPVDPDAPWHHTGDFAEWTPRGSLRVHGRREALINVGGLKIVPEVVEALLLEQPMVRDAAVHAVPHPLTGQAVVARVVFAGAPDPPALVRALRAAARQRNLPLAHVPTRIEPVDALDRTALGKRARPRVNA